MKTIKRFFMSIALFLAMWLLVIITFFKMTAVTILFPLAIFFHSKDLAKTCLNELQFTGDTLVYIKESCYVIFDLDK